MNTQFATTDKPAIADNQRAGVSEKYTAAGYAAPEAMPEKRYSAKAVLEKALNDWSAGEGILPARWDYAALNTKSLVAHINAHRTYIRETLPEILHLGAIVVSAAGEEYPETKEIYHALVNLDGCAKHHMTSEEYALFPYILEMENVRDSKLPFVAPKLGRVEKPIRAIENEHLNCIRLLNKIRELSGRFNPPAAASQEQGAWYEMLKKLDADMHLHIHLENNILFPRALALEAEWGAKDWQKRLVAADRQHKNPPYN